MRRFNSILFAILLFAGAVAASAQAVPSATGRQVSITAGGMASIFQPDFEGNWVEQIDPSVYCNFTTNVTCIPAAHSSQYPLIGVGAYVDVRLRRWVQFEAEGRWNRWHQYNSISQDNYLIGPRLPVYHFWKATVYGKALGGYSKMNFGDFYGFPAGTGKYTDLAFGGGVDLKLSRRLSLRAVDVEYHYWPNWASNSSLSPYGASVGLGYKIF
jgi:hypothetical protein